MLTSSQCRTHAARFSAQAELGANKAYRDDCLALATGWLRVAAMADFQDRTGALHQDIPN
jgi:hypothetical protein